MLPHGCAAAAQKFGLDAMPGQRVFSDRCKQLRHAVVIRVAVADKQNTVHLVLCCCRGGTEAQQ